MDKLDIRLIPALTDNYIYLIRDVETGAVGVVDPAESEPVEMALADLGWRLTTILNTHHHADHTAGNRDLKARWHARVIGPAADRDRIPEIDTAYAEGEGFSFGVRPVRVFDVPGHTRGHIAFWFEDADALFSGDALFSLGCGRLFEGTPDQMWTSLLKLRALPDSTRVYCGHEYTQSNARYARSIDPDNAALAERAAEVDRLRATLQPTLPTLLGREKAVNPFLRADDPAMAAAMGMAGANPVAVFAAIRRGKDNYRG
ncbi:hydroxyacylglutathione hydrolase [Indioceanicola profundi]|uniref:hydroxyacylglutathione hydrolase n=1 Tax=Indioceanicola profundi TaxID=2220096 RepID=UPI000E6ACB19|nr:hydroxyacylglutathione hydrolase [Indioceanicola profundi]